MGFASENSLLRRVLPHRGLITTACFCVGFLWVCVFPSFDKKTEIEEHALVAGYGATKVDSSKWAPQLSSTVRKIEKAPDVPTGLRSALSDVGLDFHELNVSAAGRHRTSALYSAASAFRSDSREAIVLVVAANWTGGAQAAAKAAWGLSIGVVLADYFQTVQWLSKDVLIVFVDKSLPYGASTRGWLSSYFGGSSAIRRGVLRQALVLDIPSQPSNLYLDVEGINGALPNQDIVNIFERQAVAVQHRGVWNSVRFTFGNGGVHSSHAAFLEFQVPAFTVRGTRSSTGKASIRIEDVARACEATIRCMSNALQQLHHSFNFYFYTNQRRHISNGLYLYPAFLMLSPLAVLADWDMRSYMVGNVANIATAVISGSPIFLLATDRQLVSWLNSILPISLHLPPACENAFGKEVAQDRRDAVFSWLAASLVLASLLTLILRNLALSVFRESAAETSDSGAKEEVTTASTSTVPLAVPLWEAMRAAAATLYFFALAPMAIYCWAAALPLTMVVVPLTTLARPWSLRRRPVRSLLVLLFLAVNFVLIVAPPTARSAIVGDAASAAKRSCSEFYFRSLLPAVPPGARQWMPTPLVTWIQHGGLDVADMPLALFESARDFNCVGGMSFVVFCFLYWPLLVLSAQILLLLPAQRVEYQAFTFQQMRLLALSFVALLAGAAVLGVMWRSYSAAGLGKLEW